MGDPPAPQLVSVVIPCYRQGHLLPQAVGSVLTQTYRPIEIVVVNDGSDDDTDAVARGLGDRIVYISKPNGGLSSARNTGIERATGDYLVFLDSDDLLHPEAVGRMVHALAGRPADSLAVIGYQRFVEAVGDAEPPVPAPVGDKLLPGILSRCHPVHAHLLPTALVRRLQGFDTRWRANEDLDFWLRLSLLDPPVVPVAGVGAYYRRTPGAMNTDREHIVSTGTEVFLRFADRVVERPSLATAYGPELLGTLYALRRRLIARGTRPDLRGRLTRVIGTLHRAGARVNAPLTRRMFDRLPSAVQPLIDRVALSCLRVVSPGLLARVRGDVQET